MIAYKLKLVKRRKKGPGSAIAARAHSTVGFSSDTGKSLRQDLAFDWQVNPGEYGTGISGTGQAVSAVPIWGACFSANLYLTPSKQRLLLGGFLIV